MIARNTWCRSSRKVGTLRTGRLHMRRSGWWFLMSSLSPASRRERFFSVLACLFFGLCAFTSAARAQTTSTIEGSVTDRQGLAVAGAEVRLAGDTVGFDKTTVTDATGNYQLA